MGKAGLVFIVLLALAGAAVAQEIPSPPLSWAQADKIYPSARVCGECHPNQYKQWSMSSHAYANVSPMFNKFEQKINDLASGTIGHFCVRCHASVGTSAGELRDIAWWDRGPAAREGITCITCHRVGEAYGKTNGARRITPGSIHEPVFGPFDTTGGLKAISDARNFHLLVSPDQPDRKDWIRIHQTAIQSTILPKSELCTACHQVAVHAGIKLETVWEEYRASPAFREGVTCQQCHMSPSPGQKVAFPTGAAATIPWPGTPGQTVRTDRPLTDHTFVGPGYPISHPGLFPLRLEPSPFTAQQWLKFDYRAKWGSDEFESGAAATTTFPPEWQSADARRQAWQIIQENYTFWEKKKSLRRQLLMNASRFDGPYFDKPPQVGQPFAFKIKLTNLNTGHNLPSGSLGAQPELWINVALTGPDGKVVWESGYVDSNGDMADLQSLDVIAGKVKYDPQLVNMQAKFITTNVKGTDREMYLPINLDIDQLPFIRPGGTPPSILNHPPLARMEKRSIPPTGSRTASYKVPAKFITQPGPYRLSVRLRGRTEPIYFMKFVGATEDMIRSEEQWADDTHSYWVEFGPGESAVADDDPTLTEAAKKPPEMSPGARLLPGEPPKASFGPEPDYNKPYSAQEQFDIYGAKHLNDTATPLVHQGIRLYDRGGYTPRATWLGEKNPIMYGFMAYGDLRVAGAHYDNGKTAPNGDHEQSVLAARLNLDMDAQLTATERLHAFIRPFDKNGQFTRYQISGGTGDKFVDRLDFNLETLFFEGDIGNIRAGLRNKPSSFDLPFVVGRFPMFTQNGIWLNDAFNGASFAITAKNSPRFDISNMDLTFFAGFDKVTTAALTNAGITDEKANLFGVAGFSDLLKGYAEWGYGYLSVPGAGRDLSYHNVTAAFSRRYRGVLANSVRVIGNFGQKGPNKTADGALLLLENSFVNLNPTFIVPYINLFIGVNSPQSLARNGDAGGVLNNTGINFESDGLTGYPTLANTAQDAYGGAFGWERLFPSLNGQLVLEAAVVQHMGSSSTQGDQYALGVRYQHKISNAWIVRADTMHGWRQGQKDVFGVRLEIRRKF